MTPANDNHSMDTPKMDEVPPFVQLYTETFYCPWQAVQGLSCNTL